MAESRPFGERFLHLTGKVFDLAQRLGVPALKGVAREVEGPLLAEVDQLLDRALDPVHAGPPR